MSAQKRSLLLRNFFREKGWIAELPNNYVHYVHLMADLIGGRVNNPIYSARECMKKGLTYEYQIIVSGYIMCTIPAMTDEGNFIIQGSEKVVVIQENRLVNEPFVTVTNISVPKSTSVYTPKYAEACCELFVEGAYVPTKVRLVDNSVIELDTSMIHKDMRGIKSIGMFELLIYIFESDMEHIAYIARSYCEKQLNACMTYIISSIKGTGGLVPKDDKHVIRSKMFGGHDDDRIVATLVTMIVSCVSVHLKYEKPSDRNDYMYKCLRTPGETVYKMFKYCVASCKNPKNLKTSIENHIHGFIKRGDTTLGGRTYSKMAIQLSRRSTIDVLSCVRKVMIPCDENSPNLNMRQIHISQKGFICPCETPEGKTVGITKSLACCCLISIKTNIIDWINKFCKKEIFPGCVWIVVDGVAFGWCNADDIISLKSLYPTVSVAIHKHNIVKIRTVAGRPIRPLLCVKDHPVDWNDPNIVYLDPVECADAIIASVDYEGNWKKFTHMEIHPCTMLGLAASLIPFPEHNQSARNVFSSSMVKQAMQMNHKLDKSCNTLQKPLVYTTIGREVGYDENPNGLNLVVCIMCINGFNQEDAIIVKKSSVDRGMFSSVAKHTTSVIVNNPWNVVGIPFMLSDKGPSVLQDKGPFMQDKGLFMREGGESDTMSILHGGTERLLTEVSTMLSNPKIVSIKESDADGGRSKVHVTMKTSRTFELGDKVSSRHGQKGVVGLLMNEEDMPFNKDGMCPDIIINPHAIPSRMTVGQLLEGMFGKYAAINGTFVDGTPFVRHSIDGITKFSETETMTLGTTGEVVETPVAMGIVYYMALKHQAADKAYVRASGSKSIMSRQPISGRSKGGGLRFGEMEYDCLVAHGATKLINEVSENSDMVDAPYCRNCKIITDVLDGKCRFCELQTVRKRVPFSYVVLKDMLLSANIQLQTNM